MSNELEDAIAIVAPEIGVPAKMIRWGVDAIVVAVVALLCWAGWYYLFAPQQALKKSEAVGQQVTQGLDTAAVQSGKQAVEITVKNGSQAAALDRQTQDAIHALLKAPGANQQVDPVAAAVARRAICMYRSSAGNSSCRALLGSDP